MKQTRTELLFLIKELKEEVKTFVDGFSCDHDVGVCHCSSFMLLDRADSALEEVHCFHTCTYNIPELWPDGSGVEVCNCCGMSRSHWEQGESAWCDVDLYSARMQLVKVFSKWDEKRKDRSGYD